MSNVVSVAQGVSRMELINRHNHLGETIDLIDRNLNSGNIYEADVVEIERNREKFLAEREEIAMMLGQVSVRQTPHVA